MLKHSFPDQEFVFLVTMPSYTASFPALIDHRSTILANTNTRTPLHPLFCVTFHKLKKLSTVLYEPMPIQKLGKGEGSWEIARSTRACIFYIWTSSFILNACVVLFDSIRFAVETRFVRRNAREKTQPNHRPGIESSMFRCPVLLNKAPPRDANVQDFPFLRPSTTTSLVRISLAFIEGTCRGEH